MPPDKSCRELKVNGGWLAGLKLVIVLLPLLLASHVAFGAWCVTQITNLRIDVAKIESTRFTTADGLEIWQEVSTIKAQLASLERQQYGRRPSEKGGS